MICSTEARAARKKAQLARDAASTKPGFAELYASQPHEKKIAAEQGAIRRAERAAKNAIALAAHADAESSADVFTSGIQTPTAGTADNGGES
jgi:hypothetical protein